MICTLCAQQNVRLYVLSTDLTSNSLKCLKCVEKILNKKYYELRQTTQGNQFEIGADYITAIPNPAGGYFTSLEASENPFTRKLLLDWLSLPHSGKTSKRRQKWDIQDFTKDLIFQLKEESDPEIKTELYSTILDALIYLNW